MRFVPCRGGAIVKVNHRLAWALVSSCAAAFTLAVACKNNTLSDNTNYSSQTIDAKGGEIDGPGGIIVKFPAGAVSQPTTFSIGTTSQYPALPGTAVSQVFSLKPHGFVFGGSVTVSIPLTGGQTSGSVRHSSCDANDNCQPWDSQITNATIQNGAAVFSTPTFSLYVVIGTDLGTSCNQLAAKCPECTDPVQLQTCNTAVQSKDESQCAAALTAMAQGGGCTGDSGTSTDAGGGNDGALGTCNINDPNCTGTPQCTGIGTNDCTCTFSGPSCACVFDFVCDNSDASSFYGKSCSWSGADGGAYAEGDASKPASSCLTVCSNTGNAAAMAQQTWH
jgi:hypothetical protein